MAGLFQPKRVNVPGFLSEQGYAAFVEQTAKASKDVAKARVPTSAVEFADKVVKLGQQSPGPKLKPPAAAKPAGVPPEPAPEGTPTYMPTGATGGMEALGRSIATMGQITDPVEQAREQQALVDEAKQRQQTVEDAAWLRNEMNKNFEPPPPEMLQPALERYAARLREQREAEADVKKAIEAKPSQYPWANALHVAARSAASMGVSALRFPADIFDLMTETAEQAAADAGAEPILATRINADVQQWFEGVDKNLDALLPGDKARSKQFLTQLASGAGSMAGFLITGYAARTVGLPASWATSALGALTEGDTLYQEAEDFGAQGVQKYMALLLGAGLGMTEAIPIDRAFMRADAATGGLVRKLLENTTATSLEEFLQEYGQTAGEDLIAKYGAAYDPDRKLDPGSWLTAGVVGAVTGGGTGAITAILGSEDPAPQPVEQFDDAKVTTAVDEALVAGEQRFSEINGEDLAPEEGAAGSAGAAQAAAGAPAAGTKTAVPRPDPVRGDAVQAIIEQQAAYHGTPHRFDKFSSSAIGTGEGAQAFGHGLYFAGNKEVAEHYKTALSTKQIVSNFREALPDDAEIADVVDMLGSGTFTPSQERVIRALDADGWLGFDYPAQAISAAYSKNAANWDPSPELMAAVKESGNLYTVDIPSDEELLDWDAPLSEQPESVKEKLQQFVETFAGKREDQRAIWEKRLRGEKVMGLGELTGQEFYRLLAREAVKGRPYSDPIAASEMLRNAGIPGHRFLDGASRDRGDGSRNYVIYDDSRIEITDVEAQVAQPLTREKNIDPVELSDADLRPLPGLEKGLTGPIPVVVKAAKAYAAAAGIPHRRQREYVKVDVARAARVAQAYADMKHEPADPAVQQVYRAMAEETLAQYQFVKATGLVIETIQPGQDDPYPNGPRDVLKDINAGHIWYFPTAQGFGSNPDFDPEGNPLMEDSGEVSANGEPMLFNDVFRVVHDFFGHGLEGSGFGARGEENAWQSHMRLYSAEAVPAMTSETRGQNSWVNYGPKGEWNRTHPRETIYADQKTGIMPSWTWEEGLADEGDPVIEQTVAQTETPAFKKWFGASKVVDENGAPLVVYHGTRDAPLAFDAALGGQARGDMLGRGGVYVTNVPDYAEKFGMSGGIMPLYVRAERILESKEAPANLGGQQLRRWAVDNGYDAIRAGLGQGAWQLFVFDPKAVKSAIGNDGGFDPENDRIDRSTGTATTRQPYRLEPTRPAKGIAQPTPATPQPDVRLTAISKQFIKALDLTARQGRLAAKNRNVMGEYNRRTATIRLRTWTDFATLVHEGGHALNDMHAQAIDDFVDRHRGDFSKMAFQLYGGDLSKSPIETVLREGFAEFFRVYAMTPDYARNRWGAITTDFENTLDAADPKLRSNLNVVADQFKAWLQLPSSQLIENMVVDGRRLQGMNAALHEIREAGFKSWFEEHARRAVTWSINRNAPLNTLVSELLNQGEENRGVPLDLKRADDPRVIMRLARNSGNRAQVEMIDGVIGYRSTQSVSRGLREALLTALSVPVDTTPPSLDPVLLKSFDAYLVTRRALDEWRRYEAGEIDRPPTGAQKGDHVRHAKETEKAFPQFVKAAEIVNEYGMALWHKRYEAGLMDKETYEEGLQRQFYAPLQRDVTDKQGTERNSLTFGASVLTKGPRFKGSDRDIVSPMTVLMQMTFALERQIAENDAKKALAILADRAGAAGRLVERIPASQLVGQTFSVQQVAQRLVSDTDLSATDAADLMMLLEGSVEQGDVMTLYRSEQAGAQGENVLFFWENGKVAALRLTEKSLGSDVVNLMNGLGRENMDITMELIAGTSGIFRNAITKWPDFLIVNYIRDQMSAWVLNDVGFVPFVSGMKGMIEEVRQRGWAKSYNAAGGVMGGMNTAALHKARVDRDLDALRAKGYRANLLGEFDGSLVGGIRGAAAAFARVTELSETGTRLGLYQKAFERAKRDGLNDYEASIEAGYIATDYMDFGLNGSKMLTSRRIIPFLNAQLQGLYKMVRTLGATEVAQRKGLRFVLGAYFKSVKNLPLSRTEQQQINAGRLAWVKMASLGLLSAVLALLFKDDEDYQEAGEYLRVTGWVVPMGNGRVFWIPKPFELALVANAVERALEFASGDKEAPGRFLRGAVQSLVPPTSPPALQTLTELSINKDFFTGRDIVPDYMQALSPELQYDNYTSSLAKWMGQTFNMSPMMIDHLLSGLGASAYRDMMTVLNAADPARPAMDETDAPILRRFVRDVRRGSVSAQDFWAQASTTSGALERARASYKRYVDAGNEIAANRFLSTLDADARAYAVLGVDFKAEQKRLNPFYRARQVTTLVSAMRREISSETGLEDTTSGMSAQELREYLLSGGEIERFPMTAGLKGQVDEILSEIARREVRNTLIATDQPGWRGKERLPLGPTLDTLLAVSPEAYDEYLRRYEKAKVYDAEAVYEGWPEARDRLNSDGAFAVLDDLVAVASAGM